MKFNFPSLWIIKFLAIILPQSESQADDAIEKFRWTPKNHDENIEWEFSLIGKKVTWNVAKVLCSSRNAPKKAVKEHISMSGRIDEKINDQSGLAILENNEVRMWLSRMLSESNYQYNGLWIGGHREDSQSNWTWIRNESDEGIAIPSSSILVDYPEWYKVDDSRELFKNCLIFDRMGHNLPILVPTDCQQSKPFICSRIVTPETIIEGQGVDVDGYRYTIFSVKEVDEEEDKTSGFRRLNGGGVRWIEARLECRKRGQYLATVLSNEAANKIASIMLKSRPSLESVWLGAWSTDGIDWTWSTTGFVLSSTKSSTSNYPPWVEGHPISSSRIDEFYQRHERCLILDRHLCPDHVNPVFLDLDCEKKRPFVCQNDIPEQNHDLENPSLNRKIILGNRVLEFSNKRMTWTEGQSYCSSKNGKIASILDSSTLSKILDRMMDLYLDHLWVGGKTYETKEGWKWLDESGRALTRKGIGIRVSWCLGDDEASLPKAEPENCLNLDREGHGSPLFYGLPCNIARQHVICSLEGASRSLNSPIDIKDKENSATLKLKPEVNHFAPNDRGSLNSSIAKDREVEKNSDYSERTTYKSNINSTFLNVDFDKHSHNRTIRTNVKNDTNDVGEEFRFFDDSNETNETNESTKKNVTKVGRKLADLDEETKELLVASGYNFTDSDLILGVEMEIVDLDNNSTIDRTHTEALIGDEHKKC